MESELDYLLLGKVKEKGIVDIIIDYKNSLETYESILNSIKSCISNSVYFNNRQYEQIFSFLFEVTKEKGKFLKMHEPTYKFIHCLSAYYGAINMYKGFKFFGIFYFNKDLLDYFYNNIKSKPLFDFFGDLIKKPIEIFAE